MQPRIICGLDITGAVGAVGQVGASAYFVQRNQGPVGQVLKV